MPYPKGRKYPEKLSFMVEKGTKERIREKLKKLAKEGKNLIMSEWLRLVIEEGLKE
jgi:hypothetical protein